MRKNKRKPTLFDNLRKWAKKRRADLQYERNTFAIMAMCDIKKKECCKWIKDIDRNIEIISAFAPNKSSPSEMDAAAKRWHLRLKQQRDNRKEPPCKIN